MSTWQTAQILGNQPKNGGVRRIDLACAGLEWQAGQYLQIRLTEQGEYRAFSIASLPQDGYLSLHVKPGNSPISQQIAALASGDSVEIAGGFGTAVWQPHPYHSLILCGGTGLAQGIALTRAALADGHAVRLYVGVRHADELYALPRLMALTEQHSALSLILAVSEDPDAPIPFRQGNVGDIALADIADLRGYRVWLAGPPAMCAGLLPRLIAHGCHRNNILGDFI